MNKSFLLFIGLFFMVQLSLAQSKLTLSDAIQIALQNNYQIKAYKSLQELTELNNHPGNAGMLPTVALNGGLGWASNQTRQEFANGQTVNRNNAISQNNNSSIDLNWTLFDGLKMFAIKDQLSLQAIQSQIEFRQQVQTTVAAVILNYKNIVKQTEALKSYEAVVKVSEERIRFITQKIALGNGNKLELLQAKLDLNSQKSIYQTQALQLLQAKVQFNQTLGINPSKDNLFVDSLALRFQGSYDSLRSLTVLKNTKLTQLANQILIRKKELQASRGNYFPTVGLNVSYGYTRVKNQVGFLLFSTNLGFNALLSANWIIYGGGVLKRGIAQKGIEITIAELAFQEQQQWIEGELKVDWEMLKQSQDLLVLEENNSEMAKEALTIAIEKFRVGLISNLDLMTVQNSFVQAGARLAAARYQVSEASTRLMLLDGSLIRTE